MLIYHPSHDVNHCLYRMLLLLENGSSEGYSLELFRLMDFYLVFPHFIKGLLEPTTPRPLLKYKKSISEIPEPYETFNNERRVMFEMQAVQSAALNYLLGKKIISISDFNNRVVKRTDLSLPVVLNDAIENSPELNNSYFKVIIEAIPNIRFNGGTGLKKRSGLMEYRYDSEGK
ncbi:hypothetical protein KUV56_08275 [Ferrimonas balearica]|uniref:ABC-three component system middle component 5 n=1 Tax=Ferrimonas balearica TaxID=44012 RepID=UPI001C57A1BD|nr:ABC-three component system middle component 5 [Ferrimonas balearica]MBW3139509.1 hypothetical protein [Ferrimonas balearica]